MDETKSIIGIVVWQFQNLPKYYIWCREAYLGKDGILIANSENPVKIGDWVEISFTKSDYERYFPLGRSPKPSQFEATDYIVIPEMYETMAEAKTIRVKLDMALTQNQTVMEHHFFGKINNNVPKQFPSGTFSITIRRVAPKNLDSVWVLEQVELQAKPRDALIPIIGIVVSHKNGYTYVWCKERPPGQDITIEAPEPLGTWISFSVDKYNFDRCFPSEMPRNGFLPRYEVDDYDVIKEFHKTTVVFDRNVIVNLELDCYVDGDNKIKDIWHPFVGLIINEFHKFFKSGTYAITIKRFNPPVTVRSVWVLRNAVLKEAAPAQPVRAESNLEQLLRGLSMNDLSSLPSSSETNESSSSNQTPQRYSRLPHQTRNWETQSEYSLNTAAPTPAPRRSRGASRKREEVPFGGQTSFQGRAPSRGRTPARHRTRSRGPAAKPLGLKRAIVIKIMKFPNYEDIFVWLLDDHKEAKLSLKVAAEKFHLEKGSTFNAEFTEEYGRLVSCGPVSDVRNDEYNTRANERGGIDIQIYAENLINAGPTNRYPNIYHGNFGKILDNFYQLKENRNVKYHMWIRHSRVDEEHRWVVFEQILH